MNMGSVLIEEAELHGTDIAGLFKKRKKKKAPAPVAAITAAEAQAKRNAEEAAALAASRAAAAAAGPQIYPADEELEQWNAWSDEEEEPEEGMGNPWGGRAHEMGDLAGWGKKFKKLAKKVSKVALPHKLIPGKIGKKLDNIFNKFTIEGRILNKVTGGSSPAETVTPATATTVQAVYSWVRPSRGLPGDPEAWTSENRDEAELSGIWDSVKNVFSTAAPAAAQTTAAPAAGGSWLDTAMNTLSKGVTSGLMLANQVVDLKAKAKAVRNNTVARAYTTGAINGKQAFNYSKGDIIPLENRSWFSRSDLIAGVPNMWIAGGAAGLLALVLIMKKRQG